MSFTRRPYGAAVRRASLAVPTLVVALAVATGIAMVRLRCSPLYPPDNDVSSDIYVYQAFGTAWAHGARPYVDVYDVKGPALYLPFRVFAELRPFSMGPPLVLLTLLALASLALAYRLALLFLRGERLAAACAVLACLVTYLAPQGVPTSFTCEELAVPGVILLLWLTSRLLLGHRVRSAWWLLDGVVLGVLLWAKLLVVWPWVGMLVALVLLAVLGRLRVREVARVAGLTVAGVLLATVGVLLPYRAELRQALDAYLLAKAGPASLGAELSAQGSYALFLAEHSTGAVVALVLVLLALLAGPRRMDRPLALPMVVAYLLSLWGSLAVVRHPNNLFVPLAFTALAVPWVVGRLQERSGARARWGVAVLALGMVAACAGAMGQSVTDYHLFTRAESVRCRDVQTGERTRYAGNQATAFARASNGAPILSPGTLYAARSAVAGHQVVTRPFQFVDRSWAARVGANAAQVRYVQERAFPYVWLHVVRPRDGAVLQTQVAAAAQETLPGRAALAPALLAGYEPWLACSDEVLLRAR